MGGASPNLPVPCRGPILTDLMTGCLQAASVGAPALLAFIKSEQARWKPVIARAQIKPEGTG